MAHPSLGHDSEFPLTYGVIPDWTHNGGVETWTYQAADPVSDASALCRG